jgi:hypothetical protein
VKFSPPQNSAPATSPSTGSSSSVNVAPAASTQIAPAKTGTVRGVVRTAAKQVVPGVAIAVSVDSFQATATTYLEGKFAVENVPVGRVHVRAQVEGFKPSEGDVIVSEAGAKFDVILLAAPAQDAIAIEVVGERPPREPTKITITQEEITHIPGTNGDAIRAITNFPGVARPPFIAGLLIIRGAAPNETNIYADGTSIPIVYHFGGLSSVIPSELLDRIDFYPGNFSSEYGRAIGGIIDVGIRSPKKEWSGLLQFDLLDGRTVVEGPLTDDTRFAIAARRSWVDVWLKPVLQDLGSGVSTAPVYYDYQAEIEHDFSPNTKGRILVFGSDDRLAITLNDPASADPTFGGALNSTTTFWRVQSRLETKFSADTKWTNTFSFGGDNVVFNFGSFMFDLHDYPVAWRSDLRSKISRELTLVVGADLEWAPFDIDLRLPPPPTPGQASGPYFGQQLVEKSEHGIVAQPAVYSLLEVTPIPHLRLLPGMRIDYTKETGYWTVDPRFAFRWDIFAGFPKTTIKGGAGMYSQAPQPNESIPPFGTPGLVSERAAQYSLGMEQEFTRYFDMSAEGFYRDTTRLVESAPNIANPYGISYNNAGSGRAYGMELLVRYKPDEHFFGWIAYTLSRSEIRAAPDQPWRLFAFDQTHILTILGSYKLGDGWQIGARFRYVTGNPYTPPSGAFADFDSGSYAQISSYPPFGARLPSLNQLDIRVDKTWDFKKWKFTTYLDCQNVYNQQNPEAPNYNYNYSQSGIVSGLPILPILGVRGEL